MSKKIRLLSVLILLTIAFSSCDSYQKLLKSNDTEAKFKAAEEYFKKADYDKAMPLLEDLSNYFRGTERSEKVLYYLAYSYYKLGQHQLAAYQFKNFADAFPGSEHAEESYYLFAYNLFLESPKKDLDQANTQDALTAFQDYLNKYPESTRTDEVNKDIDELNAKLEQKAIDNAVLYYKIEDYKAAVWAIKNVIQQYPSTKDRERLEFLVVKSSYLLAKNSVPEKQKERMLLARQYYEDYKERYPSSSYDSELKKISKETTEYLQALKTEKNNEQ